MSQEAKTQKAWVGGIYNWEAKTTKEIRRKHEYPRHNWCDIDTSNIENYNRVLEVFKNFNVNCVSQRCGRGWHFFGDLVELQTWQKIWDEIRPFADQHWAPHTLRVVKKYSNELFELPIYHKHESNPPKWSKALMSFLCKSIRNENSENIWASMHHVGLDKYFQCTVYQVELK